jgi:hypothetical protein
LTHRCHQREFLLNFARDRQAWIGWLFEAKKSAGRQLVVSGIVTAAGAEVDCASRPSWSIVK